MVNYKVPIAVVTGASGYVGSELTKQLLDQGYTVRATSRDPSKNAFLSRLGEALPGKLEMWAIDMKKDGAFDEVVQEATFVFHCASVVEFGGKDQEEDLKVIVEPAINGTKNVLSAVSKAGCVKRLVLTSSIAAVRNPDDGDRHVYSDTNFSDSCTIETRPYFVSKREAEKTAWKLAKEWGIELVTICPSMILGPVLSSKGGYSVDSIQSALLGKPFLEASEDTLHIDVRDVAKAHILAAEIPEAKGRYILSHEHKTNRHELAKLLQQEYPECQIHHFQPEDTPRVFDTSKLQELGFGSLIPLRKTVLDQARSTVSLGLV